MTTLAASPIIGAPPTGAPAGGVFAVLDAYGAAALTRFVAALVLFLLLFAVRAPLLLAARVVTIAMRRVDAYASAQANPLTPPLFRPNTSSWKEADHVDP